ncbi:unnamed protein product [Linum trigynum]|uniref:Uncharacterized protein n=1 Tax=Linum trigynum TaxID=586398 RepID=A0AAV2D0G7_9ROSI
MKQLIRRLSRVADSSTYSLLRSDSHHKRRWQSRIISVPREGGEEIQPTGVRIRAARRAPDPLPRPRLRAGHGGYSPRPRVSRPPQLDSSSSTAVSIGYL